MKKNNLLRYWPITLILAGIALMAVLIVSSTPALASSDGRSALQETLPPATSSSGDGSGSHRDHSGDWW